MNMTNIEEVIEQYLLMPTTYAILMNGERGTGKTYIIKNKVASLIKNTKVYHDNRKHYKFIYLSLYGIDSIDEVYTLMALEMYPFFKSKEGNLGLSLAKIAMRGLLNFKGLGNLDEYLTDSAKAFKNQIDTKEFVIVLDDIDRKSNLLKINTLVGFINSLVEHDNNKVLMIADNQFIKDKSYQEVKEKTIGAIIDYDNSIENLYDEICKSFAVRGHTHYHPYLVHFKSTILRGFKAKGTNNLRILNYLLEHLLIVFGDIYDDLNLSLSFEKNSYNLGKLENAIKFATSICIEFRFGNISYKERKDFDNRFELDAIMNKETMKMVLESSVSSHEPKKENKTDFEMFLTKYFPQHDYHYYHSLYSFLTGGQKFEKKLLLEEWRSFYDIHIKLEKPHEAIYNGLHITNCMNLSNNELRARTDKMINYALSGKYILSLYLSVYFYVDRFNDFFKYDMDELADKLISAIERHKKKFEYVPMLAHHFGIEKERSLYDQYLAIFKKAIEVNDKIETDNKVSTNSSLFSMFQDTPNEFYDKSVEGSVPNFSDWNLDKTFKHLSALPPSELFTFGRYIARNKGWLKESDIEFFKGLLNKFKVVLKSKKRNYMKSYVLKMFIEDLQQIIPS